MSPHRVRSAASPFARLLWLLAPLLAGLGCGGSGAPPSGVSPATKGVTTSLASSANAVSPASGPITIAIVGTSDLHGRIDALPLLGGYLDALRAAHPGSVVVVDAGDMFQGTLESNLVEGEPVIEAYRALGYNAVAIGNHEFDYGPTGEASVPRRQAAGASNGASNNASNDDPQGALKARAAQATSAFPMLAANITAAGRPPAWENVKPSTVVRLAGGVDVGIIGVSTMSTPQTTIAANFAGLEIAPIADAIAREASALRLGGAEIVIVAAHAGGDCKRLDDPDDLSSCDPGAEIFEVARALPPGAVDAIVGGHTHQAVAHRVAGVPIIQSYANGKAFGRIDLTWDPAKSRVVAARLYPPTTLAPSEVYERTRIAPSDAVAKLLAPAMGRAAARRREPLGVTIEAPIPQSYRHESALGNLLASLMLDLDPRASITVVNAGSLRADLPAGPLTYGALYEALPFDNVPARVTVTGKALAAMIRKNLNSTRGVLSVAGLRVDARCGKGNEGLDVRLAIEPRKGGAPVPVKETDRIVVATTDYLATMRDLFEDPASVEIDDPSLPVREAVVALLRKRGGALRPVDWMKPGSPRLRLPAAPCSPPLSTAPATPAAPTAPAAPDRH